LASADKNPAEQPSLFQSPVDMKALRAIRQELQSILTMLSRKC